MLFRAAKAGDLKSVRKLLDDHADVNYENISGATALHYASGDGHLKIVQELLARGASVDMANK
ncbi:unnamed protein product, partial [Aphanomyces euteiches]